MSKRIIISVCSLLLVVCSYGQGPGKFNQNLNRIRHYGVMADSMQGMPKDTFSVAINNAYYKNYPWAATKNNKLYLWDTSVYRFNAIGYDSIYVRTSTDSVFGRYYGVERFLYLKTAGAGVYIDTIFSRNDTLLYKKNGVEFSVRKVTDVEAVQDGVGAMINASLQYVDATPLLAVNDRDFGDIITTGSGLVWTIGEHAVSYDQMQTVSAVDRVLGRKYSTGSVEELTGADVMTMLDVFTDVADGIVPASGGGSSNFLRADGTWAAPPGGAGTDNSNLGSGYRLVVPSSQGIKTLFNGFAVLLDSTSNTNGITAKVDTSLIASQFDILYKVNTTDTASMLTNYLRGATEGFGIDITGTQHKTWSADTTSGGVLSWVRGLKIKDSLLALITAGGTPTFQQVLTAGSTMTGANTVTQAGNQFIWTNSLTSNTTGGFYIQGTGSGGLAAKITTEGRGLLITGSSAGHTALEVDGFSTGFGLRVNSNGNGIAAYFNTNSSTTNAIATNPMTQESRFTSGTAAAGIGFTNDKNIQNNAGSGVTALQHQYEWTNAASGSETSRYTIKMRNAGSLASKFVYDATGYIDQVEMSAPSTPSSGFGRWYVNTSDSKPHFITDGGTDYDLTSTGTGTVTSVAAGFGTSFTTITSTGSVIVDSFTIATRLRVQKAVDSLSAVKINGTISANQVAVGTGANTIGGSSNLTFSGGTFNVGNTSLYTGTGSDITAGGYASGSWWISSIRNSQAYSITPSAGYLASVKYNAAGDYAEIGGIAWTKENAVDGEYGSRMYFYTRSNGGLMSAGFEMNADQEILIGNAGADMGDIKLQVAPKTASEYGMLIRLFSGATADAWQAQNSSFDVLGFLNASGLLYGVTGAFGTSSSPSSKAILDLGSTTKGFLPTRMTAAQRTAITSVPAALFTWDTDSSRYMGYDGVNWRGIAWTGEGGGTSTNIFNSHGILTADRTLTGLNNTYSLHLDSLKDWRAGRNGVARFSFSANTSTMTSGNQSATFSANVATAIMNFGSNAFTAVADSFTAVKIIAYDANFVNGMLTARALTPKNYVDSLFGSAGGGYTNLTQFVAQTNYRIFYSDGSGDVQELAFGSSGQYLKSTGTTSAPTWDTPAGSGTINSGTTGKPAYYTAATTLDDFIALDYATSGNLVTLTHQNTTDVGLVFQGIGSQSGSFAKVLSSGAATLFELTKDGYGFFPAGGATTPSVKYGTSGLLDASGAGTGFFDAAGGYSVYMGFYGSIYKNNASVIDIGQQATFSTVNNIRISAPAEGTIKFSSIASTAASVIKGTAGEGTSASLILEADEADDANDTWKIVSETGNNLTFINNATTYLTLGASGLTAAFDLSVPDEAYDATAWNGSLEVPTKNAVRDKIESLSAGGGHTIQEEGGSLTARTNLNFIGAGVTAADDAGNNATTVTIDADLNTIAGLTATTDNFLVAVSSAWASRTPSQVRTTLALVIGTNVQAWDADLDTWAGITPGSNVGTFLATASSANLRSALTDENGTGAALFSGNTSATFNTAVLDGAVTGTGVATGATASTLAKRDADGNITANNWLGGYTTTATAAGTTTLTVGSTYLQFFTGTTTQTVTLPVASTLTLGHQFIIVNNSTGNVTVNSSGGNQVAVLAGSTVATITCILTSGTSATSWNPVYDPVNSSAGKKVSFGNTITYNGTDGTTMTFPTTSATIARTDAAQTFTGVQTFSSAAVLSTGTVTVSGNTVTFPGAAGTLATLAGTETLSGKTLTAPKFASAGFIADNNGNELIIFTTTASAVNEITLANGATGNNATITASGETNTGITITGKGTKGVSIGNALLEKTSTVSDGAGAVIDASLGNYFAWTAAADRTAGTTTNPTTGQKIIIAFTASGGARTLTLPTATTGDFIFGTDITGLTATTSGKTDLIGCIYNGTRWMVVAYTKGF